ncbi:MAG: DUF881 domain-containing protein [Candidatus Sericytochromatia bacterium]
MINTRLKKNFITSWQLSVASASLFLGFLLSIQFKSQAEHRASSNIPSRRIEDMTNLLKESEEKRISLEKSILELREQLDKVKNGKKETESNVSLILTGFTPVKGAGIVVTLNDSKEVLEKGENPANGIVHNEDLLKVTNELNAAGAEAISINGNRLIATSEISCAGPTILVNKNRVAPPFEILAIGKAETMTAALEMRGGILETIKFFGLEAKIEKKNDIVIPAYTGTIDLKYSKPLSVNSKEDL